MTVEITPLEDLVKGAAMKGAPGVSMALASAGGVHTAAHGSFVSGQDRRIGADTRFQIGCLIKPMVSLVALGLHAAGKLSLDCPVTDVLSDLGGAGAGAGISLRHLLSHTAGYVEPRDAGIRHRLTWESFADFFRAREQVYSPGAVWSYSQTGFIAVAALIERVTGRALDQLLLEQIFDPLSIESPFAVAGDAETRHAPPHAFDPRTRRFMPLRLPRGSPLFEYSISGAALTAAELARWGLSLSRAGLFPQAVLETFWAPVISVPGTAGGPLSESIPSAYGHGCGHYGRLLGHNGSLIGSTCAVRVSREFGMAASVMMNAWNPGLRDHLVSAAVARSTKVEDLAATPACTPDEDLAFYVGDYRGLMLGLGSASVRRVGEDVRLSVVAPNGGEIDMALSMDQDGKLVLGGGPPALRVGLAKAPGGKTPYLIIGMSAYHRV